MNTSAIYIQHDTGNGYGHVIATIGSFDMETTTPRFDFIDASCSYGQGWSVRVACQIGSGIDRDRATDASCRKPYAIRYCIDPRSAYDGIELGRLAALAKVESKLQRALAKVAITIGEPESFEDHVLALFLACKPSLIVTRKGRDWTERDATDTATADRVRQAVRHAIADITRKLYPNTADAESA